MQVLSIFITVCLYLVQGQYFAPTFTSPVFMWSNTNYFKGKNLHVSEYSSVDNIVNNLYSSTDNTLTKYIGNVEEKPEAIFIFIEPELRTEHFSLLSNAYAVHPNGGAFSKLKGTLESYATSSLVIPYTHGGEQKSVGSTIVLDLIKRFPKSSVTMASANPEALRILEHTQISRISMEELKNLANKDWKILSNGEVDIVIICFDSPTVHSDNIELVSANYSFDDSYMHDLLQNIGGNYLAIFTANEPASEKVRLARATMMVRGLAQSDSLYSSDLVEAQIVMIPFLFILFLGICCTFGVQSDLKFDAEKKNIKK